MRQITDENGQKKFDARVHIRDKSGKITKVQPYRCHMFRDTTVFEDVITKKLYYADGTEIVKDQPRAAAPKPAPEPAKTSPAEKVHEIEAAAEAPESAGAAPAAEAPLPQKPAEEDDLLTNPEPPLNDPRAQGKPQAQGNKRNR
jgi:hypothetical protein